MAKPTPCEPPEREKIAVLMPTTLPAMSISAPPELPGLMAASVWMNTCASERPTSVRASAETMPLVTVWPTPNGLPIASTMVADLDRVGVLELQIGKAAVAALDPEHGDVGLLVLQDDLGVELAPVGERDADLGGAADLDHMRVGDDDAVGG